MKDYYTLNEVLIELTTREAAAHALGKISGGSFINALINCFERADSDNFTKLAAAFPELGAALTLLTMQGGRQILEDVLSDQTKRWS